MKILNNVDGLSIDDLDLALTERQLQKESILWIFDPANGDYQNLSSQFQLNIKLLSLFNINSSSIDISNFSIILLDCFSDSKTAFFLNEKIKKSNSTAVFTIIIDRNTAAETILELNSMGLQSYILHPLRSEVFWTTLLNELQLKRERVMKSQMEDIHANKLRERLEWLSYKEQMRDMGKNSEGNLMIESLRNSLTQAGGFGIIMSLIDMAKGFSERHGEDYIVKKNIMEMLIANNDYAQKFLDALNGVVGLMSQNLKLARVSTEDFILSINDSMKGVKEYLLRQGIVMHLPSVVPHGENKYLKIDMESITTVIEELIINGGKYGKRDSVIDVYASYVKGYFCISVKNELKNEHDLIPDAIIEQLLKPFYRYHPPVEDIVEVEKYGLGLGLTAVSYIMNKHHGMFIFSNVKDHTGDRVVPCSLTQIYLPVETGS